MSRKQTTSTFVTFRELIQITLEFSETKNNKLEYVIMTFVSIYRPQTNQNCGDKLSARLGRR